MKNKSKSLLIALILLCGVCLCSRMVFAVDYTNQTPRSDWYKKLELIPQFYNDLSSKFKVIGNCEFMKDRKDTLKLSSDKDVTDEEIGQALLKQKLSLKKNFSFTLYSNLDYDNSPDILQLFFSGDKSLFEASKQDFKDMQQMQIIKSALTFTYGKDEKEYDTVGNYFDCHYKDSKGINYAFDLVDGKVEISSPYIEAQNGLGSNSIYFQNGYKLFIPEEIEGYSKQSIFFRDSSNDIFMLFHQPSLSLKTMYNEIVLGDEAIRTNRKCYTKLQINYTYKDNKGEFTVHNYGFTPIRFCASIDELKEMFGSEELILGFNSEDNKTTRDQGTIYTGNSVVFSDSSVLGQAPLKSISHGKIMDNNGFLVNTPDSYSIQLSPFGYSKFYQSENLTSYFKELPGVKLEITPCDENGLQKTYNGRKMLASANSGEEIPYSDLNQYNSIPTDNKNNFRLTTTGKLEAGGGSEKETIQQNRSHNIVFNQLHLDLDGNGEITLDEESNPNNIFPILEGVYLIKVESTPLGFEKSENEWMVSIQKSPDFHEVYIRVFKKELNGIYFQLYNKNIILSKKAITKDKNNSFEKLFLSTDMKTIDIGKMPFELNRDIFNISAVVFDEHKTKLENETSWVMYFKNKSNGKYRFTEKKGENVTLGYTSDDTKIEEAVAENKTSKFKLSVPLINHNTGEENVYILRKVQKDKKLSASGYYILRIINENPNYISKEDYLLAQKVYSSTKGEESEKLNKVGQINVNYEFDDNSEMFSSDTSKKNLLNFFMKFGDMYSTAYDRIPELYRSDYSYDLTYYPDGTQPEELQTAAPPSSEELKKPEYDGVQVYSYFASLTESTLGDNNLLVRGNLFGLKESIVKAENKPKEHGIFINLLSPKETAVRKVKTLARTSQGFNDLLVILLASCATLFVGVAGGIVYFVFIKKNTEKMGSKE